MDRFAFRIEQVYPDLEGFDGILLAGPVLERGANFAIGDILTVPTTAGLVDGRCTGFPLIRWGQERRDWISITVSGLESADVRVGGTASVEVGQAV